MAPRIGTHSARGRWCHEAQAHCRFLCLLAALLALLPGTAAQAAPTAPGAPLVSNVTAINLKVTAPALPAGAVSLTLQKKLSGQSDSVYVTLASGLAAGSVRTVAALSPATSYTLRYLAVGPGGSTPGAAAAVTTLALPTAPGAPVFSGVKATTLTCTAPALPAGAASLTLQKKLSGQSDASYGTIAAGLAGGSSRAVSGLAQATGYTFRYLAIGPGGAGLGGSAPGVPSEVTTLALPGAPGAPVFSNLTATSVTVTAPVLPANATSLTLQRKLSGQADSAYAGLAAGLAGGSSRAVGGLVQTTIYTFRYLALGPGGSTPGAPADVTTPALPAAPEAPLLSAITATSVTVTAPALPVGATALTLQKKLTEASDTAYADVAAGLGGGSTRKVTGLKANTGYRFRYKAVGPTGSVGGASAACTTLPATPGLPVFSNITANSLTVTAPALTGAAALALQKKLAAEPDAAFADVATNLAGGAATLVTGLTPNTAYSFRYVAVGPGGSAPGASKNVTTLPAPPGAPAAPVLSNIALTSLTATAPALPANATALTLQKKLAAEPDAAFADVAAGLAGGAATAVTGLSTNTAYSFRCVAVGPGGGTPGATATVTTLSAPPGVPGAPTLSNVTTNGLSATAPALPTYATSLALEKKLASDPDIFFSALATGLSGGAVTTVTGLSASTGYSFRYVAVGPGGSTRGAVATATTLAPPIGTNDAFAAAQTLAGTTGSVDVSNAAATKEPGEPNHAGNAGGASLWYRWTAPASGQMAITIRFNALRPLMAVYTGTAVDALNIIAANDRNGYNLTFRVTAGTIYDIAVDGLDGATGNIGFQWSLGAAPANDNFAAALALSGASGQSTGNTQYATKETGEPNHAGNAGGTSLWYRWTAPASGSVTFDTTGSYNTSVVVAVYTGAAVGALTPVASDVGLSRFSRLHFAAVTGATYAIAVDGAYGSSVRFTLNWHPTPSAPANDNFASAQTLTGGSGSTTGTNLSATKEPGEPDHAGNAGGASVWYRWTAPASGFMRFDTGYSAFNPLLAVYTGVAVNALAPVAAHGYDTWLDVSSVRFEATAGTVYYLALDGSSGETDDFSLSWYTVPPPAPPGPPGAPVFSNVTQTSVRVKFPTMPDGAEKLTLQEKLAGAPASNYVFAASRFSGGGSTTIFGLTPATGYSFRCVADGPDGSATGASADVTTSPPPPPDPGALNPPTFSHIAPTTLRVHLPPLPNNATGFTLQRAADTTLPALAAPPVAGLTAWFKASDIRDVADGGRVVTWGDASGHGNSGTQPNAAQRPIWNASALAGRPTVRFAGHALNLPPGLSDFSAGLSAFVVAQPLWLNNWGRFFDFSNGAANDNVYWARQGLSDNLIYGSFLGGTGGDSIVAPDGITNGAYQLFSVVQEGGTPGTDSNASLFKNGALVAGPAPALLPANVTRHTNLIGNSPWGDALDGSIAELLIYQTALSDAQRQAVESYLLRQYGLGAATLPDGLAWSTVATGLAGQATFDDSGLAPATTYWYRWVANGPGGAATGPAASVTTDFSSMPPPAPAAPTFSHVASTSVHVHAPAMPPGGLWFKLQRKLAAAPDDAYIDVADALNGDDVTIVEGLEAETAHTFRYVALGQGSMTPGTPATVTTTAPTPAGDGTGLRAQYFDTEDFANFVFTRVDPEINFAWGTGSPGPVVNPDTFAVRWLGQVQPRFTENYTFFVQADEGVRVWVNGQKVIDQWWSGGVEASGQIRLQEGIKYDIAIEYHEAAGGARLKLLWSSASQAKSIVAASQLYPAPPPPGGGSGLRGQYYDNRAFSLQVFSRTDPEINFNWGSGSPGRGMGDDTFGAWWTGQIEPAYAETYTFTAQTDDGVRLWVDGQMIIDSWVGVGQRTGSIALNAGQRYDIRVQYWESLGLASAQLSWASPSQPQEIVPRHRLYPAPADSTPPPPPSLVPDDAVAIAVFVPRQMSPHGAYDATVTMRNVGTTTWTSAGGYSLLNPYGPLVLVGGGGTTLGGETGSSGGVGTAGAGGSGGATVAEYVNTPQLIALPATVAPGESVTFHCTVYAPHEMGGYIFFWQMVKGGVTAVFGEQAYAKVFVGQALTEGLTVRAVTSTSVRLQLPSLPTGFTGYTLQRALNPIALGTPPSAGLLAWFRGDAGPGQVDDTPLGLWSDQSGHGHNAMQSDPNQQPHWIAAGLAGRPVLRLDGQNDNMTFPAQTNVRTVIAVLRHTGGAQDTASLLGSATNDFYGGPGYLLFHPDAVAPAIKNGQGYVFGNDTAPLLMLKPTWFQVIALIPTEPVQAGALTGQPGTNFPCWAGDYAEVMLYDTALSNADRQAAERYLMRKYALSDPIAPLDPTTLSWSTLATGLAGDAVYSDSGLTPDTAYLYRVVFEGPDASGPAGPVGATTLPPGPDAPGAPVFSTVTGASVTVTAPMLPAGATALRLQQKGATEPDGAFVDVASGLGAGVATPVDGLTPETAYAFRCVADGEGGHTPGPTATVTTALAAPEAPGAPEFQDVTQTGLTALLPDLPAHAISLTLQKKFSYQNDLAYINVATGLDGGVAVPVGALLGSTSYTFRVVAVGPGGTTPGPGAGVETGASLPAAPGAPVFSNVGVSSLTVTAPALPAHADWMNLQVKLADQPDAAFAEVATRLAGGAATEVTGLTNGATYVFRYVAAGSGGTNAGATAPVTLLAPVVTWGPGSAIECAGIRWPLPGATIAAGAAGKLSSYLATDWDQRHVTVGDQTTSARHTDVCSYTWSATGGSFQDGVNTGQSVLWIAPATPGDYVLTLVVDDQNALNQPAVQGGSRNDTATGYDDAPLRFTVTVTVP